VTNKQFRELALSFPNTEENSHFDRLAFKITKKRKFATLHEPSQTANMRLPIIEQSVFCDYGDAINPVSNKWGLQGWTTFDLKKLPKELILDALEIAYKDRMC
jgi:hypothetical protein